MKIAGTELLKHSLGAGTFIRKNDTDIFAFLGSSPSRDIVIVDEFLDFFQWIRGFGFKCFPIFAVEDQSTFHKDVIFQ